MSRNIMRFFVALLLVFGPLLVSILWILSYRGTSRFRAKVDSDWHLASIHGSVLLYKIRFTPVDGSVVLRSEAREIGFPGVHWKNTEGSDSTWTVADQLMSSVTLSIDYWLICLGFAVIVLGIFLRYWIRRVGRKENRAFFIAT